MELLGGSIKAPETGARLQGVGDALKGLGSIIAKHDVEFPERRPFQGQILNAMREILAEAPAGLRTIEVWAAVARLLRRPVSKSTVKGSLAGNPGFIRLRRGRYRLY